MSSCKHKRLTFLPSRHADEAGYVRPGPAQLHQALEARTNKTPARPPQRRLASPSTFPAPLVLPGDELSFNPKYGAQSAYQCVHNPYYNRVTDARRTVYVVPPPSISDEVPQVGDWMTPQAGTRKGSSVPPPKTENVLAYLQAFYCGLPVTLLDSQQLSFAPWKTPKRKRGEEEPARIGLQVGGTEVFGIRHRPSKDNLYRGQLNLNDLLDVAMDILPSDAYALLMLVDHDLYEDDDDDFCCGRAYGGSRVAVVSWARYNPVLDQLQQVESQHAWPASHCEQYVEDVCAAAESEALREKSTVKQGRAKKTDEDSSESSAMHAAVAAYTSLKAPRTKEGLSNLWLGRFCKTASHELGHCFGMDHCVYYACVMQGTSGLTEDGGQPPYLCPIDLVKTLWATGATETQHCRALLGFCLRFQEDRMFKAFGEWLKARLLELERSSYDSAA